SSSRSAWLTHFHSSHKWLVELATIGSRPLNPQLGPQAGTAGSDDGLDDVVNLVTGQGSLGMAEGHAEVNALLVCREVAPLERIEVLDRGKGWTGGLDHGRPQVGPAQGTGNHQRQVADNRGERGQRTIEWDEPRLLHQSGELDL